MKSAARKKTILVVDDNIEVQSAMKSILEHAGYQIIQARTEETAGKAFVTYASKLNAIIMDSSFGEHGNTDGLIVAIKNSGFSKRKPVIASSVSEDDRRRQMMLGCTHQVSKDEDDFLKFIKSVVK